MCDDPNSPWTEVATSRWRDIAAHAFEDAAAPLDFCRRLAREQGWSLRVARAAIEEYRRYCFLTTVMAGEVVPSVAVDEVWHLHLTYTEDYWERFCPRALGRVLHHQPGGLRAGDSARFRIAYAETLAAYERCFGTPDERWWPGTIARFRAPGRFRRVDRERTWIIPKPAWPRRSRPAWAAMVVAFSGILFSTYAKATPMNPLDWQGPMFLLFFMALAIASVVGAVIVRRLRSDSGRGDGLQGLDASSVAYLAGGEARVVDRVVGELLARKFAEFNAKNAVLRVNEVPRDLDAPAEEVANALKRDGHLGNLGGRFTNTMQGIRTALERRGLLLDDASAASAARASAIAPGLVFAFGALKIAIGVSRDRPVALLVVICVFLGIVALGFALSKPTQSRSGARALAELKRRHARALRAPTDKDWPIALALVGTTVMTGTAFAAFHDYRQPPSSSSSDSSSSSSDSGSSSSDSGSGGDSGGSGCGGCGGGGGD